MKYVADAEVDAVVASDGSLQDVVQGRQITLWGPGYAATAGAQACSSLGAVCSLVAVVFLGPLELERVAHFFAFGILPSGALLVGINQAVLRGWKRARRCVYRLSQVLSASSFAVFLVCLFLREAQRQWFFAVSVSVLGVLLSVIAMRLVAGPSYALTSAVFRARRAHANGRRAARSDA